MFANVTFKRAKHKSHENFARRSYATFRGPRYLPRLRVAVLPQIHSVAKHPSHDVRSLHPSRGPPYIL